MTKEEVLKEYREREILAAARRVLGRYGFEGTTIDRVAEEAQVAKGTIYLYFSNKDDLLHAAVITGLRELNAEIRRSDQPAAPPLDRIRHLIHSGYRILHSHQDFIKALLLDSHFASINPEDPRAKE